MNIEIAGIFPYTEKKRSGGDAGNGYETYLLHFIRREDLRACDEDSAADIKKEAFREGQSWRLRMDL